MRRHERALLMRGVALAMGLVFQVIDGAIETEAAGMSETRLTVVEPNGNSASVKMMPQHCAELAEHLDAKAPGKPRAVVQMFAGDQSDAPVLVRCGQCGDFLAKSIAVAEPLGCPRCKCHAVVPNSRLPWPQEDRQVKFVRGAEAEVAAERWDAIWYPLDASKGKRP